MEVPMLERVLKIFDQVRQGLRDDKKERIFTLLAGHFTTRILRFYIPKVVTTKRLEISLKVILEMDKFQETTFTPHVSTLYNYIRYQKQNSFTHTVANT